MNGDVIIDGKSLDYAYICWRTMWLTARLWSSGFLFLDEHLFVCSYQFYLCTCAFFYVSLLQVLFLAGVATVTYSSAAWTLGKMDTNRPSTFITEWEKSPLLTRRCISGNVLGLICHFDTALSLLSTSTFTSKSDLSFICSHTVAISVCFHLQSSHYGEQQDLLEQLRKTLPCPILHLERISLLLFHSRIFIVDLRHFIQSYSEGLFRETEREHIGCCPSSCPHPSTSDFSACQGCSLLQGVDMFVIHSWHATVYPHVGKAIFIQVFTTAFFCSINNTSLNQSCKAQRHTWAINKPNLSRPMDARAHDDIIYYCRLCKMQWELILDHDKKWHHHALLMDVIKSHSLHMQDMFQPVSCPISCNGVTDESLRKAVRWL